MRVLSIIGLAALLLVGGCGGGAGGASSGTTNPHPELLGTRSFTIERWTAADQLGRGEMVASFLALYPPEELTRTELVRLLGRPTGSYPVGENVAYVVGPASVKSPYAQGYLLIFATDSATGRVQRVFFVPEIE